MGNFINFYTLVAFILGVMLAATVKGLVGRAKAAV